jgi:Tfp pilus assembly protein PilW
MNRNGFTLIEALLGLALSLLVITAGLEFYVRAQKCFDRLKAREEGDQAARAALDRIRIDLLHAGRGLAREVGLGLLAAAETTAGELRLASVDRTLRLAAPASAGSPRLRLVSTADIAAGRRIALREGEAGEVRTVVRVEPGAVSLDAPLGRDYAPDAAAVSLLDIVAYYLDGTTHVLRRRANASPAQPVVESAATAAWSLDAASPLARVRLELTIEGVRPHETTVFLKNAALAWRLGT